MSIHRSPSDTPAEGLAPGVLGEVSESSPTDSHPLRGPAPRQSATPEARQEAAPEEDCRREREDRRKRSTPLFSPYLIRGRRKGGRREGDEKFTYVDKPGAWILAAFTALVGLSVLDAWYTLDLLKKGATEANPVMKLALEISDEAFVVIKTVITVVGAGFLSLHKNWPLGRFCMMAALLGYSVLLFYHLYAQLTVRPVH